MKANFRQMIAELENYSNEEKRCKANSIEIKLQSSAYKGEISLREYSELIDELCACVVGSGSVGSGKGVV